VSLIYRAERKTETITMWADANVMAAQTSIGGALCESSIIPFLVPRRKVWLTLLLECRAVTLPI